MIIAVASGKGGTGKTTVSVNLARMLGSEVRLLDCDVEEPNVHLFLKGSMTKEEIITIPIPQVDESLCDGCGECGSFVNTMQSSPLGPHLLYSRKCAMDVVDAQWYVPQKAIHEIDKRIGVVETVQAGNITLDSGSS
jgi:MinD superfamily P-loop ATPase